MNERIYLVSAVQRHLEHPDTFHIPPMAECLSLRPGDYVKLIFNDKERMWVRVKQRSLVLPSLVEFEGTLDSTPAVLTGIKRGDPVFFRPLHVCDIERFAAEGC